VRLRHDQQPDDQRRHADAAKNPVVYPSFQFFAAGSTAI
jgi:hypothetical protein